MKLSDFNYNLPPELIAQTPLEKRDTSKLLILDKNTWNLQDSTFSDILNHLSENDVLVLNQTRVIKARLKWYIKIPSAVGQRDLTQNYQLKETIVASSPYIRGRIQDRVMKKKYKQVEIFLHKQISDNTRDCLVYPWKKLKPWTKVYISSDFSLFQREYPKWNGGGEIRKNKTLNNIPSPERGGLVRDKEIVATIKSISESWRIVEFSKNSTELLEIIEQIWETPLPPYIKEKLDNSERYQTVYNKTSWSVAAPTAWLHFTKELLEQLQKKWVKIEKVLLHVWLWTFKTVEVEDIKKHKMHNEYIELETEVAKRLNKYKKQWKRIISVWTTSTRVLESLSDENWTLTPWKKDTDIFIYPWYKWKFVDSLITNFHLPKSTLLMLVSSLATKQNIEKAYQHAISKKYRFFSFWDAMWITTIQQTVAPFPW